VLRYECMDLMCDSCKNFFCCTCRECDVHIKAVLVVRCDTYNWSYVKCTEYSIHTHCVVYFTSTFCFHHEVVPLPVVRDVWYMHFHASV
jgi:hypothetical protein